MAKALAFRHVPVPAEAAWAAVGGFDRTEWLAGVTDCAVEGEGAGAVRTVTMADGGRFVERLEELDAEGRRYRYSLQASPLPLVDYKATVKVEPVDDASCGVSISSTFEVEGADEDELVGAVEAFYGASLDQLAARLSA